MHNGNWDMDGGGWWWMTILMVIFWGGLILVAITLIRRPHMATHASAPGTVAQSARPTAQEILAERLARGEIEPEDYRSRLSVLSRGTDG